MRNKGEVSGGGSSRIGTIPGIFLCCFHVGEKVILEWMRDQSTSQDHSISSMKWVNVLEKLS